MTHTLSCSKCGAVFKTGEHVHDFTNSCIICIEIISHYTQKDNVEIEDGTVQEQYRDHMEMTDDTVPTPVEDEEEQDPTEINGDIASKPVEDEEESNEINDEVAAKPVVDETLINLLEYSYKNQGNSLEFLEVSGNKVNFKFIFVTKYSNNNQLTGVAEIVSEDELNYNWANKEWITMKFDLTAKTVEVTSNETNSAMKSILGTYVY